MRERTYSQGTPDQLPVWRGPLRSTEMAEGEVEPRGIYPCPPRKGVIEIALELLHGEQIAMSQGHRPRFFCCSVADFEIP